MQLRAQLRPAIVLLVVFTVLTGVVYPLFVTGIAQTLFPRQAEGSLLRDSQGRVIGSTLLGQQFTDPRYFHPRPSAAGNGYDPTQSGASNLGPTNQQFISTVQERANAYRQENGLAPDTPVPVDAVTASGSGLDPDISLANALLQVHRVATARGLPDDAVKSLVERLARRPWFGILGEPRVNVLELNRALDQGMAQ
ncbi:potassium-transporting ATPase subunit KdpC [Thermorudis peleae]|uniref:potassium-transporting ATPase subunit KdpC n=1 Tax=Thermorudis peleae TaxID=1382356 RepID=UPI000570E546|nr:potassium-transporting ATPase subunit KdpC [Thermorudis peleae]MBX6754162.1 potassium-transporting ATPase subunit KdpC [Thermorudis peleae]